MKKFDMMNLNVMFAEKEQAMLKLTLWKEKNGVVKFAVLFMGKHQKNGLIEKNSLGEHIENE